MLVQVLSVLIVIVGILGVLAWGPSSGREMRAADEGKE